MTKRWWTPLLAGLVALTLLASACGDDEDSGGASTEPAEEPADGGEETASVDVTLTDETLDGLPEEIPAGPVEVNFDAGEEEDANLDFSLVDPELTEQEFREGLSVLLTGGPFPDGFESNAGALTGTTTIVLEPGEYFVWAEPSTSEELVPEEEAAVEEAPEDTSGGEESGGEESGGEEGGGEESGGEGEGPPPESFIVQRLTVTGESTDAELPDDNAGDIVAVDYSFDVDVEAGEGFDFSNDGANEFHHAIVFDFGSSDPEALEPFVKTFLESDGEVDAPEGVEIPEGDPEAAFSGVFGPGFKGTGQGEFEDGKTYVVACFISDRSGGPPHAFGEDMYEVFTVGS